MGLNRFEKGIFYIVLIIGTMANLANWQGATGPAWFTGGLILESATVLFLWIAPLREKSKPNRWIRPALYLEVLLLLFRAGLAGLFLYGFSGR